MELLRVNNLVKRFGGLTAVNGVSFGVEKGEIFGLIGPNGSGKTTLFDLICNVSPPTGGTVHLEGKDITGLKTHRISRLGIGRTFQMVRPVADMTVLDNVLAAAYAAGAAREPAKASADQMLEFCGLTHRRAAMAGSLPMGERKRLEIARSLTPRPRLLLLDETSSGLNPAEREAAMDLIRRIRHMGVTLLMIEHVMPVVMGLSDRILALHFGRLIALGTPLEVSRHPEVRAAYLGETHAGS